MAARATSDLPQGRRGRGAGSLGNLGGAHACVGQETKETRNASGHEASQVRRAAISAPSSLALLDGGGGAREARGASLSCMQWTMADGEEARTRRPS